MNLDVEQYRAALLQPAAQESRRHFCRQTAERLQATGNVLWGFGLAEAPERRALATVLQMAASLVRGTVAMLEAGNWYAAAALCRQVVEVEYLAWLFSTDPAEAAAWLSASQADLRRLYSPAAMRQRSNGRFRDREYWSHCEIGGHPNPKGAFLLEERLLPSDRDPLNSTLEWLWVDLAQHLDRMWMFVSGAVRAQHLERVRVASDALTEVARLREQWEASDECAQRFPGLPEGDE